MSSFSTVWRREKEITYRNLKIFESLASMLMQLWLTISNEVCRALIQWNKLKQRNQLLFSSRWEKTKYWFCYSENDFAADEHSNSKVSKPAICTKILVLFAIVFSSL